MGLLADMAREAERQRQAQLREQRRLQREYEAAQREAQRQAAHLEKERQRLYTESRVREVDEMNQDLAATIESFEGFLSATLSVDDFIDLDTLKPTYEEQAFAPGSLGVPNPEPELQLPPAPQGVRALVPGAKAKHQAAVAEARAEHEAAVTAWRQEEQRRLTALSEAEQRHKQQIEERRATAERQHVEIERFKAALSAGEPSAIVDYLGMVLEASRYPDEFPKAHKIAYVPESRQVVVEHDLPPFEVVPEVKAYKYVKSRDEITTTARPATHRRALYSSLIAQAALRTVHELFEANRNGHVETVTYNGMVESIDKRTGQPARVCVVSLRTTREAFQALDLSRVDPQECLRGLNAGVSRKPSELAPVRPVVEFKMVDDRFTDESDVLSELDQRPNLMELSPAEFESLITNLFERMGLETRQTRPSRDGGVDCVAWDTRPVMGGKVVIQAKRYKNTVGVSAVRDLFGTVHNEGAGKGILVTTSGYGQASFSFAENKPLELLDGNNLLYLLKEHAGIDARIEPPEDWVDPEGAATV